jgi:hypothetical protein
MMAIVGVAGLPASPSLMWGIGSAGEPKMRDAGRCYD